MEDNAARSDARIRFLKTQVEILRRNLRSGDRAIPSPNDHTGLLAIGQERARDFRGIIGIVTPLTNCRWVKELCKGRRARRVGRPEVVRSNCELVTRLAKENAG